MITRLYIDNYKCFSNFLLAPESPTPLMIIGRNGVGKSSLGLVLSLLRDFAMGRALSPYFSSDNLSLFAPLAPITLEADVTVDQVLHKVRLVFSPSPNSAEGYRILAAEMDDVARADLARIVVVKPEPEKIVSLVRSGLDSISLDRSCANVATWFAFQEDRNPAIRDAFRERMCLAFEDFVGHAYRTAEDGQRLCCLFKREGGDVTSIELAMLSDGEKCQFIAAALSVVNENVQPLVCFWDEPDNYITTSEEASLFYSLSRSFLEIGQFIATSHSELGILTFNDEETYVFDRRDHSSPILPPANLAELRRTGRLTGSLQNALVSGEVSL